MTNIINRRFERKEYTSLIIYGMLFFILLLSRDVYSININKNVFIALTCLCAVTMKIQSLLYLFCFLFPLYVGLPGNYMTLILVIRLIFSIKKFKLSKLSFGVTYFIAVFMFCQNIITGYTGIVPMMFIVGIVVVLMMFSYKERLDTTCMIVMYAAGVAALGYIMLESTLNVYDMSELMETSFRLGSSNVDYVEEGVMNISMDPNFYGMFALAAIATSVPLAFGVGAKMPVKIVLSTFTIVDIFVCLVGLSRTFVLMFVIWIILYLLSQKNIKGTVVALIVITAIVFIITTAMPDVLEVVLARFKDSDMATGNGRMTLIAEFFEMWQENMITILFGVGLYNCNVHCMPLQFLFGGGIVLFVLIILLFISYGKHKTKKRSLARKLPFVITFIMMGTVPAACMLDYMFPIIFTGLLMKNENSMA